MNLPRYKCHKEVSAAKIKAVIPEGLGACIVFEDLKLSPLQVSEDFLEKHPIHIGGYFVLYDDGYQSFSPAKAFEEGYTKIV